MWGKKACANPFALGADGSSGARGRNGWEGSLFLNGPPGGKGGSFEKRGGDGGRGGCSLAGEWMCDRVVDWLDERSAKRSPLQARPSDTLAKYESGRSQGAARWGAK